MKQEYLLLGEITKPQGIRGEVKVRHYTDDPDRFSELESVYVQRDGVYANVRVLGCRVFKEDVFIKLEGVEDRNEAEKWRGVQLYIDRAHARKLNDNEFFIADVIGAKAFDTKGRELGTLREVLTGMAAPVLVLDTPRGALMTPALDDVLLSTDVEQGKIVLNEERLLEVGLYEDSDTDAVPRDV